MVKKLVKDGYIGREPSKQDGRSYTLFITHSGRQLVELAYAEYTKTVETMRREMGDENFSQLLTLIQQANTVLKNK